MITYKHLGLSHFGHTTAVLGKVALSLFAMWLSFGLLGFLSFWTLPSQGRINQRDQSSIVSNLKNNRESNTSAKEIFWPLFPGRIDWNSHEMVMNGVKVITEDWKTTASGSEVLTYYKQQMLARGWRDVTEETYKLRPETRDPGVSKNSLQDPNFVDTYSVLMECESCVGPWIMDHTPCD